MPDRDIYCPTCETEVAFGAPPCPDGHEDECPELVCTACGTAIFVAPVTLRPRRRPAPVGTTPHHRRHAA